MNEILKKYLMEATIGLTVNLHGEEKPAVFETVDSLATFLTGRLISDGYEIVVVSKPKD